METEFDLNPTPSAAPATVEGTEAPAARRGGRPKGSYKVATERARLAEVRMKVKEQLEQQEAAAVPIPRPEMRPEFREEDPRVRAERRAAELRDHAGSMDDGQDDFFIDPAIVPEGWSYEWKRKTVMGQEDPAYQVQLARKGWESVPAGRHPSYMPVGGKHTTIERKGMILMERPLEITEEAREHDLKRARMQIRQKEAQLNSSPDGQFERRNKDAPLSKVNKSYERLSIPKD